MEGVQEVGERRASLATLAIWEHASLCLLSLPGSIRPPGPSPVLGLTRDGWEDVMKRLYFTLNTAPVENWLCPSTVQGPGCTSARLEKVPS